MRQDTNDDDDGSPTQSDGVVETNSSQGQPRRVSTGHATKSKTTDEGMSKTRRQDVTLNDAGGASTGGSGGIAAAKGQTQKKGHDCADNRNDSKSRRMSTGKTGDNSSDNSDNNDGDIDEDDEDDDGEEDAEGNNKNGGGSDENDDRSSNNEGKGRKDDGETTYYEDDDNFTLSGRTSRFTQEMEDAYIEELEKIEQYDAATCMLRNEQETGEVEDDDLPLSQCLKKKPGKMKQQIDKGRARDDDRIVGLLAVIMATGGHNGHGQNGHGIGQNGHHKK